MPSLPFVTQHVLYYVQRHGRMHDYTAVHVGQACYPFVATHTIHKRLILLFIVFISTWSDPGHV